MKTALVTGGTGYIGSYLVKELVEKEYAVTCLVRPSSHIRQLKNLGNNRVKIVSLDSLLDNSAGVSENLKGIEQVFHLAAATYGREHQIFRTNIDMTQNILNACKNSEIRRFNFISSIAARKPSTSCSRIDENSDYSPVSPYGKSKAMAERAVRCSGIPFTIYSPGVVVGPGDKEMLGVYRLIKKTGIATMIGDRHTRFGFIYVGDLTDALIEGSSKESTLGKSYILASGNTTQTEYLNLIGNALGKKPYIIPIPFLLGAAVGGISDIWSWTTGTSRMLSIAKIKEIRLSWECDSKKFSEDTGWKPKLGLEEAIKKMASWIESLESNCH